VQDSELSFVCSIKAVSNWKIPLNSDSWLNDWPTRTWCGAPWIINPKVRHTVDIKELGYNSHSKKGQYIKHLRRMTLETIEYKQMTHMSR